MSTSTSPAKAARKDGKTNGSSTRASATERKAPAAAAAAPEVSARPSEEEIALRAYEIYEREGCQPGTELQNWLRAEAELCGPKGH